MIEKRKITIHPSFGGKKIISEIKEPEVVEQTGNELLKTARTKKPCFYCQNKTVPTYTDIATLRRYQTDRAKIIPKLKNNLCSKHQRGVSKNIKYARHLALLPFTPKV